MSLAVLQGNCGGDEAVHLFTIVIRKKFELVTVYADLLKPEQLGIDTKRMQTTSKNEFEQFEVELGASSRMSPPTQSVHRH